MNKHIDIPLDDATLPGDLEVPEDARALVVFAHGSGSSRLSPRNRQVAAELRRSGTMGTLLFDLLTPEEDATYANRFNIALLARRLEGVVRYLAEQPEYAWLPVGLFGASTGAASAIVAAVALGNLVRAVVSRGGRPDLAGDALYRLSVPTLLIVGANDHLVIELNHAAYDRIPASEKRIELVSGATHLFEEPGALEIVSDLAADWFERFLVGASSHAR